MDKPFISIIVPVRNAQRTINTTFEYLMDIEYPQERMEMVFADGGSSDDTVKVIKKYQETHPFITLVEIPDCPSPGFARTQALKVAKGDFIFFTDGDCAPVEDWVDKMLEVFNKDEKIGAVGGEIYTLRVDPNNLVEIYCEAFGFNRVSWRYGNLQEGLFPELTDKSPTQVCGHRAYFFVTANVAYRKEAVEDGERRFWELPTGEDIDFGLRVRQKEWKFYFLPQASVRHMHRADLKALLRVWASYSRAHPPLINAHASKYMEIILQFLGAYPNNPCLKFKFPIKGFVYIGNFHLMHLFGLLFIGGLIGIFVSSPGFWWKLTTFISLFLSLVFTFKFFRAGFRIEPYNAWPSFCKMKYLTNLYFMLGGFKGIKKYKVLCIEPSF
ncbi:MAG: glycosyltransferase [Candidatus Omnitrophica bacterium]|nr:glycosyltransferase [Candidatus Omnitrophota bacterium]